MNAAGSQSPPATCHAAYFGQAEFGRLQFRCAGVHFTNANAVDPTFETSPTHRFNGYFVHEVASITGAAATAVLNLTAGTDPFGVLSTGELFRFFAEAPNYSANNSGGGSLRRNIEMAVGDTLFNGIIVQDPTKLWASFGVPSVASGTTDASYITANANGTQVRFSKTTGKLDRIRES